MAQGMVAVGTAEEAVAAEVGMAGVGTVLGMALGMELGAGFLAVGAPPSEVVAGKVEVEE